MIVSVVEASIRGQPRHRLCRAAGCAPL